MDNNYEWGISYANKYGEITKITDNLREIPEDWILRFYFKDKRGNIFLKHKKNREICIEINAHYISKEGELYSEMFAIARELRENGKKRIALSIENIIQKEIESRLNSL